MKISLAEFTEGYIECALWCGVEAWCECTCDDAPDGYQSDDGTHAHSSGDGHEHSPSDSISWDPDELSDKAREQLEKDARDFVASNIFDLMASTLDSSQAGHDFWLTRNGHGAGFWDRGHISDEADEALERLTEASKPYGSCDLTAQVDEHGCLIGKIEVI